MADFRQKTGLGLVGLVSCLHRSSCSGAWFTCDTRVDVVCVAMFWLCTGASCCLMVASGLILGNDCGVWAGQ